MSKYIDAEKLKKAIEDKGLDCSFALKMERIDTLALIDELQQEQPEVDLEKYISGKLFSLGAELIKHKPYSFNRGLNVGATNAYHDILTILNARKED